jgi:prevent-host-death family protein
MTRRKATLYSAKARLSALVREARAGHSTVITVHGEPVAELIPYRAPAPARTIEARIAELRAAGEIRAADSTPTGAPRIHVVGKARGILSRFLAERD